ncbi:uncharacterized protein LOC119162291 [Rhipicephalus microplus]|uniref:uncharacterized protein LOC119162291 n=1 Tax=Rhipicephalus microplus TaxID=6941 RepID=UPI003F6AB818
MNFVAKTVMLTALFVLFLMTDVSSYIKGHKGHTIRLKNSMKSTIATENTTTCTYEGCKRLCQAQLGNDYVDVTGHCEYAACKCFFKEPCRPVKCQKRCQDEARKRRAPNANGTCQRTQCICLIEDDCDQQECNGACQKKYPGRPSRAKGQCIDGECTCRRVP